MNKISTTLADKDREKYQCKAKNLEKSSLESIRLRIKFRYAKHQNHFFGSNSTDLLQKSLLLPIVLNAK